MKNPLSKVGEMFGDLTRSLMPFSWSSFTGVRQFLGYIGTRFWPTTHPAAEGSTPNYEMLRSLYRSDGEIALGSGFAKPIINVSVNFMGLPRVLVESEFQSDFLNECIHDFWASKLVEAFTAAIRDSKVIVKMCWPDILDPLMTMDEASHATLEIIPPDLVDIERDARNKNVITRVVIHRRMTFVIDEGNPAQSQDPQIEEHDVLEIIDQTQYRFFDQNENRYLDQLAAPNRWNFVPILEMFNEWDSTLQGGQSDLESVIPFLTAFHDVLVQGLQAHKYHSTPKLKLKIKDVAVFIKNNFPDAWDETTGTIKNQSTVALNGREVYIFESDEDAEFLEARSVLGDTKTLAEFLIDCICIASETPEWAFMRVDSGSANSDRNAQTVPLLKKVERKRNMFAEPVQQLCKMVLVSIGSLPVRPQVTWEIVRYDDEFVTMQAFQQLVMGLEVARSRNEISDDTYMNAIRAFLPQMKAPSQEKKDIPPAPEIPALPAPPNPSQTGAVA
jgi:hypothetical protein